MSWDLIRSLQKRTDLRLILPFGLSVEPGDVVRVGKDGNLTLEGTCESLLNCSRGRTRVSIAGDDIACQFGKNTNYRFRTKGDASLLFPELPSVRAGFDISFGSQNGVVFAVRGRSLSALQEVNRFRIPILDAARAKVWKEDWVLVTGAATVDQITLIASRTAGTKVALDLTGKFSPHAGLEVKLTAGATIVQVKGEITQRITSRPTVAFVRGIRVKGRWFPKIGDLGRKGKPSLEAPDSKFWEDMDVGL